MFSAGRSSEEAKKYHLDIISGLLREIDIPAVFGSLPSDEAAELVVDLKILGFH
ncbi:hypothetical protein D3C87_1999830 [compost metagenome]